ncbi:MAG: 2'-5' RNA ligase family protein [Parvularculaceae bacterium]|nr:2'-5' RNA ligase family protein [Parvularculaceae bacterium]
MQAPLIVTLQLDARTADYFDRLRAEHFPPAINYLKAHLTLFHNLPGTEELAVLETLVRAALARPPFAVTVAGLMKLGRGTAFRLESAALLDLRAALADVFAGWLVKQDKQKFRPHVTVQNKVAPSAASALFDHLSANFTPFDAIAEGMQLWRYEGGPWSPVAAIAFQGRAS